MTEYDMSTLDTCVPGFRDLSQSEKSDIAQAATAAYDELTKPSGETFSNIEEAMFLAGWIGCTVATLESCRADQEGG